MRSFFILLSVFILGCSLHKAPIILSKSTTSATTSNTITKSWLGEWERRIHQNDASLKITGIKGDSLAFSLQAMSGGHSGEVEGIAFVRGNIATYVGEENNDTCLLEFELIGDTVITIDQKRGNCFAGMGVDYNGDYKNSKYLPKTEESENLVDLGVFETKQEDSVFRSLVGDNYSLFINSTQLVSEDNDLDSLNATVRSSGVKGLYTISENIIMIDSSYNIWAAVLDNEKVYYFTNNKEYKHKLPKTIEDWRSRFSDYEVIYK
jgi:hypothetical protein